MILLYVAVCISSIVCSEPNGGLYVVDAQMQSTNKSLDFVVDQNVPSRLYVTWKDKTVYIWQRINDSYEKVDEIVMEHALVDCYYSSSNDALFMLDDKLNIKYGFL